MSSLVVPAENGLEVTLETKDGPIKLKLYRLQNGRKLRIEAPLSVYIDRSMGDAKLTCPHCKKEC